MTSTARRVRDERGAVLLSTLAVIALLAALGGALAVLVASETFTSANYRTAQQTLYAAESGIDFVAGELRQLSNWRELLLAPPGNARSAVDDGMLMPRAPDGSTINIAQLTTQLQADSQTRFGAIGVNPNTPVWQVYARASFARLLPADVRASPAYIVVWVADDVDDSDGDAQRDSNGVIMIRSVAFGIRSGRRTIEATLARAGGGEEGAGMPVRLLSWREVR